MGLDRKYLVLALVYAVLGMSLGIFMAASHNHGQFVTHAHVLLIGFVVSLIYGVIHKLWLREKPPAIAGIQFIVHQVGAATVTVGLFLLYGGFVPMERIEPVPATGSIIVLLGALMMLYMVLKSGAVKRA